MVNLSFSLPGDIHKCGMETAIGGEILTRVGTVVLLTLRLLSESLNMLGLELISRKGVKVLQIKILTRKTMTILT